MQALGDLISVIFVSLNPKSNGTATSCFEVISSYLKREGCSIQQTEVESSKVQF